MTLARRLPQVTRTLLAGQMRVRTETRASSASGYVSSVVWWPKTAIEFFNKLC